jgi:hypothetical protein
VQPGTKKPKRPTKGGLTKTVRRFKLLRHTLLPDWNITETDKSIFSNFKVFSVFHPSLNWLFSTFQLSSQYELWAEQLQNGEIPRGKLKDAEVQLRNLSDHINHIQGPIL